MERNLEWTLLLLTKLNQKQNIYYLSFFTNRMKMSYFLFLVFKVSITGIYQIEGFLNKKDTQRIILFFLLYN